MNKIDKTKFLDKEFIKNNVRIGIQKIKYEDGAIKRASWYDGLEEYLLVICEDGMYSYGAKLTMALANMLGITCDNLWDYAYKNTVLNMEIENLYEIIMKEAGLPLFGDDMNAYLVTNKEKYKGAGSAICREMISRYAKTKGFKRIAIIPSSVHEMIFVPTDDYTDKYLLDMIKEINMSSVDEKDRLIDMVYYMNID